jgi:hypothetical protein
MPKLKKIERFLREAPDAEFPEGLLDRLQASIRLCEVKRGQQVPSNLWRVIMKSRITKLAAAAVVIAAILAALSYFGPGVTLTTPVFAEVMEEIRKAQSVTYKETFHLENGSSFSITKMITASGVMRSVLPGGAIIINDFNAGKNLQMRPGSKKALVTYRIGRNMGRGLFNYLDWVSSLHQMAGQFVRQEEVNGRTADVFLVEKEFQSTTIWVDPDTDLPVQVERVSFRNPQEDVIVPKLSLSESDFGGQGNTTRTITIGGGRGIQENMKIVMTDFVWNADLDESLFSLEPPEDYTVEEQTFDVSDKAEMGLIDALAFWTEMSGGWFPSKINDLGDPNQIRPMLIEKFDRDADPKEELDAAMKQVNLVLKGLWFAQERKVEGNWFYDGQDVRLGDADSPVCWWKVQDSNDYRVIYGNLSLSDSNVIPAVPEGE